MKFKHKDGWWFAWYPVYTQERYWVWLQKVYRHRWGWAFNFKGWWSYSLKK